MKFLRRSQGNSKENLFGKDFLFCQTEKFEERSLVSREKLCCTESSLIYIRIDNCNLNYENNDKFWNNLETIFFFSFPIILKIKSDSSSKLKAPKG